MKINSVFDQLTAGIEKARSVTNAELVKLHAEGKSLFERVQTEDGFGQGVTMTATQWRQLTGYLKHIQSSGKELSADWSLNSDGEEQYTAYLK